MALKPPQYHIIMAKGHVNQWFGGPRGGWSARRGTPQRGGVRVAQSARKPCQLSEVCGTPPGRPGSGAMWPGRVRYPHRTTHWSGRATVGIRGRRGAVHVARRSPEAFLRHEVASFTARDRKQKKL